MNKKLISIISVIGFITLVAAGIIWASKNTLESKKQNSIVSCTDFGASIVNLSEPEAISKLGQADRVYRIAQRDSQSYPLSMDFSPDRINLFITNDNITSYSCG